MFRSAVALALVTATSTAWGASLKCEQLFAIRGNSAVSGITLDSSWTRIFDVLPSMTKGERDEVKEYAGFYIEALNFRNRRQPFADFESAYLTGQAKLLSKYLNSLADSVGAGERTAQQSNWDRSVAKTLQILKAALDGEVKARRNMDWKTLVQFELLTGAIEDFVHRDYSSKGLFDEQHDFNYSREEDLIRKWAQELRSDPSQLVPVEFVRDLINQQNENFQSHGLVRIPMIRPMSAAQGLAIAFLPILPLRLASVPAPAWEREDSASGGELLDWDMASGIHGSGFETKYLQQGTENQLAALNASWTHWYFMLGGNLNGSKPNERSEFLVRALLSYSRYVHGADEFKIDWTSADRLIALFFHDFMEWDGMDTLNPNILEFFENSAAKYFAELRGSQEPMDISQNDLFDTLDILVGRLVKSPDYDMKSNPALKQLMQLVPGRSVRIKYLINAATEGTRPKSDPLPPLRGIRPY